MLFERASNLTRINSWPIARQTLNNYRIVVNHMQAFACLPEIQLFSFIMRISKYQLYIANKLYVEASFSQIKSHMKLCNWLAISFNPVIIRLIHIQLTSQQTFHLCSQPHNQLLAKFGLTYVVLLTCKFTLTNLPPSSATKTACTQTAS